MEPSIVEAMLIEQALPNFARLRAMGGYDRLSTTHPAQTPVAWSTFATGLNPGGHGIYDFLRRDPRTYLPDLALSTYERRSALLPPRAVNLRSGVPVWETLGKAGIPSAILRCPCTYPPEPFGGRLLAGMGVPDVRGGLGTANFYSTVPAHSRDGEIVHELKGPGPAFRGVLVGPRHRSRAEDVTVPLTLIVDAAARTATLALGGQAPAVELRLGRWSGWLPVRFGAGVLTTISGKVRVLLARVAPYVELYVSPVNFDARAPMFPISHPWSYAGALEEHIGSYATLGMPEDHTGLTNGRFDEDAFLVQCDVVMAEREAMLRHELHRFDHGLLFCLFDTPDRLQHMFWRFREPSHPANRTHGFHPRYARVIETHYQRCDAVLGEVLRAVDDRTTLMVLSDHGFSSFQRGVHLNGWLRDKGWLSLRGDASPGDTSVDFFQQVDWSKTRAYALGFGSIYINVAGREAEGIVPLAERSSTAASLARQIEGLPDPERGQVAVLGANTRDALYRGPRIEEAPDVVVEFAGGYRASWETALGAVPQGLIVDNTRKWGGDHIVAPSLVPGVIFMNRPFRPMPRLIDCNPSILASFGLDVSLSAEGESVLQ